MTSRLCCAGCGTVLGPGEVRWACPLAGDGRDHVLVPVLSDAVWPDEADENPFIRYRRLLHAYAAWTAGDAAWVERVGALDEAVARVGGVGFRVTPVITVAGASAKDETGNVAGSHKARHLFSTLILAPPGELAIASCGNAALAAAVLARADDRPLRVFVPEWADGGVVRQLRDLGAMVETCPREGGLGDPCVGALRAAVAAGAVPFTCQGPDNALALDSGRTLGWELAEQVVVDRVCVQVGGGALATCVWRGLEEAVTMGRLASLPRLHAVQAAGAAPLVRAWEGVSALAAVDGWPAALETAARERSRFMWPWDEPASAATGILDDEAYDWLEVVRGTAMSGGTVVSVSEGEIADASAATAGHAGPTGAAGLAGGRKIHRPGEMLAVILTGRT